MRVLSTLKRFLQFIGFSYMKCKDDQATEYTRLNERGIRKHER